MGITTDISWCDSTVNAEMGCNGCELSRPEKHCYAEAMTDRYAGNKGWPTAFNKPQIFPQRIPEACKWPDLTGTKRKGIPGLPRLIFLNDMGDTFTKSLPFDWLSPYIGEMVMSGHIWQVLTKNVRRMEEFFIALGFVPDNFWLGTSITTNATLPRINTLNAINAKVRFLSIEPMLEPISIPLHQLVNIHQVIVGGESGPNYRLFEWDWARKMRDDCRAAGVAFFMKQGPGGSKDIPADLQIREFPRSK
jgi:protein gp37